MTSCVVVSFNFEIRFFDFFCICIVMLRKKSIYFVDTSDQFVNQFAYYNKGDSIFRSHKTNSKVTRTINCRQNQKI